MHSSSLVKIFFSTRITISPFHTPFNKIVRFAKDNHCHLLNISNMEINAYQLYIIANNFPNLRTFSFSSDTIWDVSVVLSKKLTSLEATTKNIFIDFSKAPNLKQLFLDEQETVYFDNLEQATQLEVFNLSNVVSVEPVLDFSQSQIKKLRLKDVSSIKLVPPLKNLLTLKKIAILNKVNFMPYEGGLPKNLQEFYLEQPPIDEDYMALPEKHLGIKFSGPAFLSKKNINQEKSGW